MSASPTTATATRLAYLDHAATTPMRPEAVEAMLPFLTERFANPSGSHRFARDARRAIDEARDVVADVLGVPAGWIVFTGCGTESDNAAITGVLAAAEAAGHPGTAVGPASEHHAVLHPVEHHGGRVVAADASGRVDLDALADTLRSTPDVRVVSVMTVNNEVGSITDLAPVNDLVRALAPGAVLHTDAVQAPSWFPLSAITPFVDLLSLSAHKFGGPKGVGVLMVRDGTPFEPLIMGGGQERERRSGTHNVAGIVAAATALAATDAGRDDDVPRIRTLRDRLVDTLLTELDEVIETVPRADKVAGSAHVCIAGIESEALLYLLDQGDVCASAASACASGAMEPSHVLAAMGVERRWSSGALRMSLGSTTTDADVDRAGEIVVEAVRRLRASAA